MYAKIFRGVFRCAKACIYPSLTLGAMSRQSPRGMCDSNTPSVKTPPARVRVGVSALKRRGGGRGGGKGGGEQQGW